MTSKLKTLIDIDSSGPDVFETPDVEVKATGPTSSSTNQVAPSEDVLLDNISMQKSATHFRNALLETVQADFSDQLAARKMKMYKSFTRKQPRHPTDMPTVNGELEVITGNSRTAPELQETPLQKLRRLLFEVDELESELTLSAKNKLDNVEGGGSGGGVDPSLLVEHVAHLQNQLKQIETNEKFSPFFDITTGSDGATMVSGKTSSHSLVRQLENLLKSPLPKQSNTTTTTADGDSPSNTVNSQSIYELFYAPESATAQYAKQLKSIDERISTLETVIGAVDIKNTLGSNGLPVNMMDTLIQLDKDVSLLSDPAQLDLVSAKCQALSLELDNVINKKYEAFGDDESGAKNGVESEVHAKINKLYDSLENLQEVSGAIIPLLERLNSLKSLHVEAANFADSISSLSKEQQSILEAVQHAEELCIKLEKTMESNEAVIMKNISLLNEKSS